MHRKITDISHLPVLFLFAALLSAGLCGCNDRQEEGEVLEKVQAETDQDIDKTGDKRKDKEKEDKKEDGEGEAVYVHVCGQVQSPGVYELPGGSRVFQAVDAAGGLTETAAPECLNEAAKVADGQQIYVPAKGETNPAQCLTAPQQADDGKVNINTASAEELMSLNGIGEARAAGIIKFREEHGGFQSTEELKEIEGIKDGIFNKIKDQITV